MVQLVWLNTQWSVIGFKCVCNSKSDGGWNHLQWGKGPYVVELANTADWAPHNFGIPKVMVAETTYTLLQGLTRFFATQTGCRWLILYIEQKKCLACGPEFSVDLSAPPEFSGSVTEKYLSTGWARTFDLQIRKQIFYHCATAPLCSSSFNIHCVPSWDFPAVSVVTGSRIFRPYLVVTCRDFPAVSAVTGSRIFRPYL